MSRALWLSIKTGICHHPPLHPPPPPPPPPHPPPPPPHPPPPPLLMLERSLNFPLLPPAPGSIFYFPSFFSEMSAESAGFPYFSPLLWFPGIPVLDRSPVALMAESRKSLPFPSLRGPGFFAGFPPPPIIAEAEPPFRAPARRRNRLLPEGDPRRKIREICFFSGMLSPSVSLAPIVSDLPLLSAPCCPIGLPSSPVHYLLGSMHFFLQPLKLKDVSLRRWFFISKNPFRPLLPFSLSPLSLQHAHALSFFVTLSAEVLLFSSDLRSRKDLQLSYPRF